MLNSNELKQLDISDRQFKMLTLMYEYDEGWMTQQDLDSKLEKLYKNKN